MGQRGQVRDPYLFSFLTSHLKVKCTYIYSDTYSSYHFLSYLHIFSDYATTCSHMKTDVVDHIFYTPNKPRKANIW